MSKPYFPRNKIKAKDLTDENQMYISARLHYFPISPLFLAAHC